MAGMSQMPTTPPPMRVESLSYQLPAVAGERPGLVSAIGIMSIVVGSLGVLANGLSLVYGAIFWIASATNAFNMAGAQNAMAPQMREQFVARADAVLALGDRRKVHLDRMLVEHGTTIMGGAGKGATATPPPVTATGPLGVDGQYYVLPTGRIDVGDDFVAFTPNAGAPKGSDDLEADPTAAAVGPISDAQADGILQSVRTLAQTPPDATQEATVKRVVRAPWQELVDPAKGDVLRQVVGVPRTADGGLMIHSTTLASLYLPATSGGPFVYAPAPQTGATANGGGWFAMATLVAIAELALAVYLLVIGILVFRWSRNGRRQHWWYVALKLPVVVLGTLAWWRGFDVLFASSPQTKDAALGMTIITAVSALVVAAYPIGLIFALGAKSVRDYYAGLAGTAPAAA